jgi:hypothetical protein
MLIGRVGQSCAVALLGQAPARIISNATSILDMTFSLIRIAIVVRSDVVITLALSRPLSVMRGLDPRIHFHSQEDGSPGQARR